MRSESSQKIDADLAELDQKIKRLRIEYEQYFRGTKPREPIVLKGEVQRFIQKYVNEPPRNSMQKFKFNTLCARYQAFRTLWGRTLREIEAGTYKGHRFKASLHQPQPTHAAPESSADETSPAKHRSPVDQLYDALVSARGKTGEVARVDRSRLEQVIRKQAAELKQKHPDARVSFRVVIEDNRARLKASLKPV